MKLFPCTAEISHYKVAEKLLESGVTMVRILRNRPGVELPDFLNTPIVNLNFSYRYGISDFEVDEKGIRASLSFRGVPHFCDIPWTAICAIMSENTDQLFVWINVFHKEEIARFLPPEMRDGFDEAAQASVLEEFPELKEFTFDGGLRNVSELEDSNENDEESDENDEDDEDDDLPPGGFTPLHFV